MNKSFSYDLLRQVALTIEVVFAIIMYSIFKLKPIVVDIGMTCYK